MSRKKAVHDCRVTIRMPRKLLEAIDKKVEEIRAGQAELDFDRSDLLRDLFGWSFAEEQLGVWSRMKLSLPAVESGRSEAILRYMLVRLGEGKVPDAKLVRDFMDPKKQIPACGHIECVETGSHIH